jgi:DNA-binding transcriptional MerR regulator
MNGVRLVPTGTASFLLLGTTLLPNQRVCVTFDRMVTAAELMTGDRTFRTSTVCELADLPPSTLRSWRARRLLATTVRKRPRRWSAYSTLDTLRICAMAELTRRGVTASVAAELVAHFEPQTHHPRRRDMAIAINLHTTWQRVAAALRRLEVTAHGR